MIDIQFRGTLNGVTNLTFRDDSINPYNFTLRVACTRCREEKEKPTRFNRHNILDIPHSKGQTNLVMTCKFCNQHQHITVLKVYPAYEEAQSGEWKTMLELDCRGVEVLELLPDGEFTVKSLNNASTFVVTFEDNEWYDYDDLAGSEISITETSWRVVKAK